MTGCEAVNLFQSIALLVCVALLSRAIHYRNARINLLECRINRHERQIKELEAEGTP